MALVPYLRWLRIGTVVVVVVWVLSRRVRARPVRLGVRRLSGAAAWATWLLAAMLALALLWRVVGHRQLLYSWPKKARYSARRKRSSRSRSTAPGTISTSAVTDAICSS
jgi:hypothetical protein